MRLFRRPTRWLSGWMILVLLCAQLATATYACPAVSASSAAMAEMPGCDGHMAAAMDPDQPQLCKAHCQQGSQTVHPTPAPDAPSSPVLLAVLDWSRALAVPAHAAERGGLLATAAAPPGAPPLYLSLLVLRN